MRDFRLDEELPLCIVEWRRRYHHLGIPTTEKKPDEKYLVHLKFYHSGFPTSPYGIEWMRFEEDSPIPYLVQKVPHLAFEVDDLDYELANRNLNVITPPNLPSEGIRIAIIEYNEAQLN
ncbi:VOC family protein [Dysgonomonas sp. Marseille-P4361]|uniref:VOC family protein n=1 Tax=Dysgonomonas sp. Marseille-P4361 TaxID=2161820 RepID=UPI000D5621A9|nr:hypothetical protein [Dysgonomonas sp. Marseille-P4361]